MPAKTRGRLGFSQCMRIKLQLLDNATFSVCSTLALRLINTSKIMFTSYPPRLVSWCFEPSQPQRVTSGLILSSEGCQPVMHSFENQVCWTRSYRCILPCWRKLTFTRCFFFVSIGLRYTLEGGRRRGRQRKCWMDNVKQWTSLPMPKLLTIASSRKRLKTYLCWIVCLPVDPIGEGIELYLRELGW